MSYCFYCMRQIEDTDRECPFCGESTTVEVPSHHLKPGTVLSGKFIVGTALGEGGFGITYIGRDTKLDMKVAIKEYYPNGYVNRSNTISPDVTSGTKGDRKEFFDKGRERFLREARILAKFSGDPGIVDVRDFFEENNTAYIVMEYLDGEDLKEYLKRKGTLAPEQAIRMLMPIMKALTKIHAQGLIHRDISPDNIRLVEDGVKLMDFGAARDVSATANKSLSVMLKPGYAPEEQYRSKGEQGPWTDVYALCATIYKCITGITPDDSTQRVFSDELKTPSALGVLMDPTLETALMKGLSVLQKDRYQSIAELINGFKGINASVSDDGKTVYSGKPVSEDDISTRYMGNDDITQANPIKAEEAVETPVYDKKVTDTTNGGGNNAKESITPVVPVDDQSAPKNPKKNGFLKQWQGIALVGGMALIIVVLLIFLIIPKDSDEGKDNGDTSKPTTSDTQKEEVSMSDNIFDFTFELDGTIYKLPCNYSDFTDAGWTISSTGYNGDTTIKGNSYDSFYMSRDGKKIYVSSYNFSGNSKKISECKIGAIECQASYGSVLKMAKGITYSSTADEIKNAYGTPSSQNKGSDYQTISYELNGSNYNKIKFYISDDSKYSSVEIMNFVQTANDNTETNNSKPDYLSTYKAPASLGTDMLAGVVNIEGDLYQLPAPVSAFLDNGWEVIEQSGAIVSGGTDSIRVEKNGKEMYLQITNYADYQTTAENCAVYRIAITDDDKVDITVPCGNKTLKIGTPKADVESCLTDKFSYYAGTYNHSYDYSEYREREFNLSFRVDVETELLSEISVSRKDWPYK